MLISRFNALILLLLIISPLFGILSVSADGMLLIDNTGVINEEQYHRRIGFITPTREWVFYYKDNDIYYRSRLLDGVWGSAQVAVSDPLYIDYVDIHYNSLTQNFHLIYGDDPYVFYCMGYANDTSGSISLYDDPQLISGILENDPGFFSDATISAYSDDYPMIAWVENCYHPIYRPDELNYVYVALSASCNGTWVVDPTYPWCLNDPSDEKEMSPRIICNYEDSGDWMIYWDHDIMERLFLGINYDSNEDILSEIFDMGIDPNTHNRGDYSVTWNTTKIFIATSQAYLGDFQLRGIIQNWDDFSYGTFNITSFEDCNAIFLSASMNETDDSLSVFYGSSANETISLYHLYSNYTYFKENELYPTYWCEGWRSPPRYTDYESLIYLDASPQDILRQYYYQVESEEPEEPEPEPGEPGTYSVYLRRYENGTVLSDPYDATIRLFNGTQLTETISADNTTLSYESLIYYFTYPLGGGEYKSLFYPPSLIYPIIPQGTQDTYLFTIRDLSGYLSGKTCVLEAYRNINGTTTVISSIAFTTTVNGIPLKLTRDQIVELKLYTSTLPSRYSFGYFYPAGSPLTHTLIFNYFDFEGGIINSYLSADAQRSGDYEEISVEYENTLIGYDFNATANIYAKNGTLIDTDFSEDDSYIFTFPGLEPTTDYYATLSIYHSRWEGEEFIEAWALPGNTTYTNSIPDFSDLGWSLGGVTELIPTFLLLVISGVFSFVSAPIGILVVVLFAGVFSYTGIMTIPLSLLSLAFSLAVIFIIGRRVQNS